MAARRVKRRVAAANIVRGGGLRIAAGGGGDRTGYSAHSLRAGCATEAASRGVEERDIGRHTRHRSIPVLRGYIRAGTVFVNNASARLGL